MQDIMILPVSTKPEGATRHLPVARGRELGRSALREVKRNEVPSRKSEPKLQVAVVRAAPSADPYADVPCTD